MEEWPRVTENDGWRGFSNGTSRLVIVTDAARSVAADPTQADLNQIQVD
jgi:hypothetical protein